MHSGSVGGAGLPGWLPSAVPKVTLSNIILNCRAERASITAGVSGDRAWEAESAAVPAGPVPSVCCGGGQRAGRGLPVIGAVCGLSGGRRRAVPAWEGCPEGGEGRLGV